MLVSTDVTLSGSLDFNATSVEIAPITIAGTEWFERHFGCGAVSATVKKSVAMFEVIPDLNESDVTWCDPNQTGDPK
jgi:hypothetical protein